MSIEELRRDLQIQLVDPLRRKDPKAIEEIEAELAALSHYPKYTVKVPPPVTLPVAQAVTLSLVPYFRSVGGVLGDEQLHLPFDEDTYW